MKKKNKKRKRKFRKKDLLIQKTTPQAIVKMKKIKRKQQIFQEKIEKRKEEDFKILFIKHNKVIK